MAFTDVPEISWKYVGKPYDLNSVLSPDEVWAKLDLGPEEVRQSLIMLINELKAVVDANSGADNIGMTPITVLGAPTTIQSVIEALVSRLQATTDNASGADLIGATSISGLSGASVQALLESLKSLLDSKDSAQITALANHKTSGDHDGRYYTETESDAKFETITDLTNNRKLSATGDFTGTLNGAPITSTDPGLSSTVVAMMGTGAAEEKANLSLVNAHLAENATVFQTTDNFQAVINASTNKWFMFPAGKTFNLATDITFPDGSVVFHFGTITGSGSIIFAGSGVLQGNGVVSNNPAGGYSVLLQAGKFLIDGIKFLNNIVSTAGLGIVPTASIRDSKILNCHFEGLNYAILKNGGSAFTCTDVLVEGNHFYNLKGDAIEWNMATTDRDIRVKNNVIDTIDGVGDGSNWGIGIGFAGGSYFDYNNRIEDIEVSGNTISNVRQAIHFEACNKFKVFNNKLRGVSTAYSTATGLESGGVVAYGCKDFEISNNHFTDFVNSRGIYATTAVSASAYVQPSINYTIKNNIFDKAGGISSYSGGYDCFVNIIDNICNDSTISHFGSVTSLKIIGNNINTVDSTSVGLTLDFYSSDGRIQAFNAGLRRIAEIINNTVRNPSNSPTVSLLNLLFENLTSRGNNFEVYSTISNKKEVGRTFYTDAGEFPYGIEFLKGDLVIDTTTPARWLVTVSGSRNRGVDNFQVLDAPNGVIASTNLPWTTMSAGGHHEIGQRITLSNIGIGGVSLQAIVQRVYADGGYYKIKLDRVIPTVATGTITATNPVTFVAV